jgi:hypothetical protein
MKNGETCKVIIIGAGAAGVGLGVVFEKMGFTDYVILEQNTVGSSFKKWPSYTRFISPSFTGNSFGAVDLNSVTPDTSPAYNLKSEHPTGLQYAEYLELVADHFNVRIQEKTVVAKIEKEGEEFLVHTSDCLYKSQFVVWAGGEFNSPNNVSITGAEHCIHSSNVHDITDKQVTIIGGFESGMELAIHLLEQGKEVTIVDSAEPWAVTASDSSIALAPHTLDRLRPYIGSEQLQFIGNTTVTKVTKETTGYAVHTDKGTTITTPGAPILATGFSNLPAVISDYFTETNDGHVTITDDDESTSTPNVFLAGPKVRHGGAIFCFIYKFRQRLPIIAETIMERLDIEAKPVDALDAYEKANMYLRDLSCCTDDCAC